MVDFSRLSKYWYHWAPGMGGPPISVSTDCRDCQILFSTADYSVHLGTEGSWWVVDTVDDRGYRRKGVGQLSNFDLAEKYLIWHWSATVFHKLGSGIFGTDSYRKGFAPEVETSRVDTAYKLRVGQDCAILRSVVQATIFSHFMSKPVNAIEESIRQHAE